MKFCIRDDDTSYYTCPSTLDSVYQDIWDVCPVTLACIPMISPDADSHTDTVDDIPRNIRDNSRLVTYLSNLLKENKVEMSLHGYHHDTPEGSPEFVTGKKLKKKVSEGINMLENTFDTDVNIFVPPHVRISRRGVKAVQEAGLNIVRGYGPRPREVQLHSKWWYSYSKIIQFYLKNGKEYRYPYPLDYGTHREIYSHRLNRNTDMNWLTEAFDYINNRDGVFCLSVHSERLNKRGKNKLEKIVEYARKQNAECMTASEVFGQYE